MWGGGLFAPAVTVWFRTLETIKMRNPIVQTATRVGLDQFVFAPCVLSGTFHLSWGSDFLWDVLRGEGRVEVGNQRAVLAVERMWRHWTTNELQSVAQQPGLGASMRAGPVPLGMGHGGDTIPGDIPIPCGASEP